MWKRHLLFVWNVLFSMIEHFSCVTTNSYVCVIVILFASMDRIVNLELMSQYGCDAWKLSNSVLQQMLETARKQLIDLKYVLSLELSKGYLLVHCVITHCFTVYSFSCYHKSLQYAEQILFLSLWLVAQFAHTSVL